MADETEIGSAGAHDRRGHPRRGAGEQSPLQARAAFLKNRSWEFVVSYNAGACARGGAQHGFNREAQEAVARQWEEKRIAILSLAEALDFLRPCHRSAPFLFFNGNTFSDIGRRSLPRFSPNSRPVVAVRLLLPLLIILPVFLTVMRWRASLRVCAKQLPSKRAIV